MTKVDKVKEKIIETSLYLFNTNGITYTSIQDIMTATELSKGAIYRRFKNKEEIVLAAYDKSGEIMWGHYHKEMEDRKIADHLEEPRLDIGLVALELLGQLVDEHLLERDVADVPLQRLVDIVHASSFSNHDPSLKNAKWWPYASCQLIVCVSQFTSTYPT